LENRIEELTPYYQLHIRGERARRLGEREEQLRFLRQELDLYPGSAAPYSVAWAERNSNHPRRAIELLKTMDPERGSMREFFAYWSVMTDAYHMLGEHEQELREAQRAEPLYPERLVQPLDKQVIALAALGRVREVHSVLDRVETLPSFRFLTPGLVMHHAAMEMRAHGHHADAGPIFDRALASYQARPDDEMESDASQYALAQIYYGAEQWSEARQISESLAKAHPDDTEYQGFLGLVAAHSGDRETALERDEWLAGQRPQFFPSIPIFWRALLAAGLGESERAMTLLREAYDRGLTWRNRHYLYHSFELLYGLQGYQELMRPKD
jgi:predicted Zn-dependent protease